MKSPGKTYTNLDIASEAETPPRLFRAIGLMSGTSLDAVDAALIETDGARVVRPLGFVSVPYGTSDRATIRAAFGSTDRRTPEAGAAERLSTALHAAAVEALLAKTGAAAGDIDLVGYHGQTVYHAPKDGVTIQLGDGAMLARDTGIDVVDDFRSADVAAGGEGAPLAPLYHAARARAAGLPSPVAILNIGGVANVTWIGDGDADIVAFDTGPGNALLDDWTKRRTGAAYDRDGALAASGRADPATVRAWLAHPYFDRRPPKSLDRDQWDIAALGPLSLGLNDMNDADGAATLMQFTVEAIAAALAHLPAPPERWYVCGGGRHNAALMRALAGRLPIASVDDLGWDGDATEAECFAYLAVRSRLGLPISLPGTTGVANPMTGGILHRAADKRNASA